MKPGDLSTAAGQIQDALTVLRARWSETATLWTDRQRRDFEGDYLAPLEPQVMLALERMSRLSQMIYQARHECS